MRYKLEIYIYIYILLICIYIQGRTVDQALPYIIFGCLYISVAFLSLLLPETKGTHLPITIADAIELEKYVGFKKKTVF